MERGGSTKYIHARHPSPETPKHKLEFMFARHSAPYCTPSRPSQPAAVPLLTPSRSSHSTWLLTATFPSPHISLHPYSLSHSPPLMLLYSPSLHSSQHPSSPLTLPSPRHPSDTSTFVTTLLIRIKYLLKKTNQTREKDDSVGGNIISALTNTCHWSKKNNFLPFLSFFF